VQRLQREFAFANDWYPWGTTAAALGAALGSGELSAVRSDAPYGFRVWRHQAYAAPGGADRAVQQLRYDLPLLDAVDTAANIADVERTFGAPSERQERSTPSGPTAASVVVRALRWELGSVDVRLSIYGAPRLEHGVHSVGSLWVSWNDVVAAAAPLLTRLEQRQTALIDRISAATLDVVELDRAQRPAASPLSGERDDDEAGRRARRALESDELLSTPPDLARRLDERSVAVWRIGSGSDWGVATRFDSVWFQPGQSCKLGHYDVLPAKGAGHPSLTIGDLTLSCAPSSLRLLEVVRLVEQASGRPVPRHVDYDA
jgi:hypothetical protein